MRRKPINQRFCPNRTCALHAQLDKGNIVRHLTANGCSVHTIRSYRVDLGALGRFMRAKGMDVASIVC